MTQKISVKKIEKKTASSFPNLFPRVLNNDEFELFLDFFKIKFELRDRKGIYFETTGPYREDALSYFAFSFEHSQVTVKLMDESNDSEISSCFFKANLENQNFKEIAYSFLETCKKFNEKVASSELFIYDKLSIYFPDDGYPHIAMKYFKKLTEFELKRKGIKE